MQRSTSLTIAFLCVLTCVGLSQTATPSASSAPATSTPSGAPAANPSAVAPTQDVITLKGACDPKGSTPAPQGCVSGVTRDQFEKLSTALKPDLTDEQKRTFAQNYGKMLIFADAARALGLENDPKVLQIMQFAKNQILLQAISEHYSAEYAHPSDQQIDDYYRQNSKKYGESTLQRLVIPRKPAAADTPKSSDAEETAYVDQVRQKWVAGGDPVKLQSEAMEHAGIKQQAPDVNVGPKLPGSLPVAQEGVFDLKAGEISQPFADPAAFYLYKVVSVRQIPLSEVKDSIARTVSQQLIKDKMDSIANSATPVLNETYFGPASATPASQGPMSAPHRQSAPPPGPGPSK